MTDQPIEMPWISQPPDDGYYWLRFSEEDKDRKLTEVLVDENTKQVVYTHLSTDEQFRLSGDKFGLFWQWQKLTEEEVERYCS